MCGFSRHRWRLKPHTPLPNESTRLFGDRLEFYLSEATKPCVTARTRIKRRRCTSTANPAEASVAYATQHHGKELSYINLLDADGALSCVKEFSTPAACIVKHTTPCGAATAADLPTAFQKRLRRRSAGGVRWDRRPQQTGRSGDRRGDHVHRQTAGSHRRPRRTPTMHCSC